MKTTQAIIFHTILMTFVLQYYTASAAEEKAVEAVTATVMGKTIEGLAAAGPYATVAVQAYNIGQEIRKHTYPTIEERYHAEKVAERFVFLTTENEFQKCLIDNRSSIERHSSGRPMACEDITKMFNMLGERSEVDRITTTYNQVCDLFSKGQ